MLKLKYLISQGNIIFIYNILHNKYNINFTEYDVKLEQQLVSTNNEHP